MKWLPILLSLICLPCFSLELPQEELRTIGTRIWQNECRGTLQGLVSWNEGEDFPSLGIGHFIWYPKEANQTFEETFPALLSRMKTQEIKLPFWLAHAKHCPWKTRADFLKDRRSKRMNELRDLLSETLDLQMRFVIERFDQSEENILATLEGAKKEAIAAKIALLKETPKGLFALIDYVNFKGTGLSPKERYRGQGWGLLQVLQQLPNDLDAEKAPAAFTKSARHLLTLRTKNAPPGRNEERWLKGWNARLDSY
jgi:hypothetical protein